VKVFASLKNADNLMKGETMSRYPRIFLPLTGVLILSAACLPTGFGTPDPNAVATIVAQTVAAGLTQNASQEIPSPPFDTTATPSLTFTLAPPSSTPTDTPTPIPIFTATPEVPMISVSVPTNCRNGPGRVYDRVGSLLVGRAAEVYGRDPTGNYWYIRNPGPGAQFCWVWGEYATLSGPFQFLPVFTPPPTPTPTMTPTPVPDFAVKYAGLDSCSGWWVEVEVKNISSLSFRSHRMEVRDTVTGVELVALRDGFTDLDGCLRTTTKDILNPGDTFILSAPPFSYNPAGNEIRLDLTLCTDTGQRGGCISKRINFTP
jgi:hypothetical protein